MARSKGERRAWRLTLWVSEAEEQAIRSTAGEEGVAPFLRRVGLAKPTVTESEGENPTVTESAIPTVTESEDANRTVTESEVVTASMPSTLAELAVARGKSYDHVVARYAKRFGINAEEAEEHYARLLLVHGV